MEIVRLRARVADCDAMALGMTRAELRAISEKYRKRYIQDEKTGRMLGSRPDAEKSLTSGGGDGKLQSSPPTWSGKLAKEPFDYWELCPDKTEFPRRWKPTGFSKSTIDDHFERHGAGVGASGKEDYIRKAKEYLMSPRGVRGDAFVRADGTIGRYDYDTKLFSIAYPNGIVGTYWNLSDSMVPEKSDAYWQKEKTK